MVAWGQMNGSVLARNVFVRDRFESDYVGARCDELKT